MALGCGGPSRLGLSTGRTTEQSAAVVQAALDAGVNFIDTATAYRTEPLVAAGLRSRSRDRVVLSSKRGLRADRADDGNRLLTGAELEAAVEASLRRLETDYIDIYHLHGVSAQQYPHAREEIVPALQRLQEAGKVRFLGITERFGNDTGHVMLRQVLDDGLFDVIISFLAAERCRAICTASAPSSTRTPGTRWCPRCSASRRRARCAISASPSGSATTPSTSCCAKSSTTGCST